MPGVREDVTDIVLNLKGVAVKMEVEGPKRLEIRATGPGVVTAGDISTIERHRDPEPRPRDPATSTTAPRSTWS